MSIEWREHTPNISLQVPDWETPCTDVLALPHRLMVAGEEGYYRIAADGPLGKAAEEFYKLYKSYLPVSTLTLVRGDGTREEQECCQLDDDLLLRKLFGQTFDLDMRTAFARCLLEIGVNPAELIAIGERVYAEYVQAEADRMTAWAVARSKVDELYGKMIPQFVQGEVLDALRRLLTLMTQKIGRVPEVWGWRRSQGNELMIAMKDIEAMIGRKIPRGAKLPRSVTRSGRRYFMTLHGLCLFGYEELRTWYFEDQDNERVADLYFGLTHLQYRLMNSTSEGRQVLDNLFNGLFGGH